MGIGIGGIRGREGSIKIERLGAVIGQFSSWTLQREMVGDDRTKVFTLRGQLSYVNPALFGDADYSPVVLLVTGKDPVTRKPKQYRLEQDEGRTRSLDGRNLLMEGVRLASL